MLKRVKCITINTDASFSRRYEIGTYAFYIVCDLFKIHYGGILSQYLNDSKEAELMSIGNAIAALLQRKSLPICNVLVINTDCTNAILDIRNKSSDTGRFVAKLYDKLYARLGCVKGDFRHVKAHTRDSASRSRANEWCDKEAKRWMGIAIIKEQHKLKKHGKRNAI
jgi:ribonuclease HI